MWADCHEYDKIAKNVLKPTQYVPINPIDANTPEPHPAKESNGKLYDVSIDSFVPLYISGKIQTLYVQTSEFPKVRDMWGLGTSASRGWAGIWYRYGKDALASSPLASTCPTGNTWTWLNYGNTPQKRSEALTEDDKLYQNLTAMFNVLVDQGYSPKTLWRRWIWMLV